MDPYQTDGVLSMLRRSPKTPEQTPKEAAKPSVYTRLRAATKSSTRKDGAPVDGKPPARGLFSRLFSAKPKEQWDVNSKYLNLTKTYGLAQMYHFGDERTPRYGILFGSPKCQYFREVDILCDKTNSYVLFICKVCPNDIQTKLTFHTNGLPTNYPEWQQTSLLPAQYTQIQWIENPTQYFNSKSSQQPIRDTTIAENHEAAGEVEATPVEHAEKAVNPYFVQHNPVVEPVAHEMVPPLPVPPATPVPAPRVRTAPVSTQRVKNKTPPVAAKRGKQKKAPVSAEAVPETPAPMHAKPVPVKPASEPVTQFVTKLHLPSETEERYKLTKTHIMNPKDGWLRYAWAITEVEGKKRFVAIYQFETDPPEKKTEVLGWISDYEIDVAFHLPNLQRLDFREWTKCQIRDIKGLMYIKHPELYFEDIIKHNIRPAGFSL
jgi:hypothetical protein